MTFAHAEFVCSGVTARSAMPLAKLNCRAPAPSTASPHPRRRQGRRTPLEPGGGVPRAPRSLRVGGPSVCRCAKRPRAGRAPHASRGGSFERAAGASIVAVYTIAVRGEGDRTSVAHVRRMNAQYSQPRRARTPCLPGGGGKPLGYLWRGLGEGRSGRIEDALKTAWPPSRRERWGEGGSAWLRQGGLRHKRLVPSRGDDGGHR